MKRLAQFTARSALVLCAGLAHAQFPMIGNMMPGLQQMQAIEMQRHQARTLLYRAALEELRKNPQAADIGDCPLGATGVDLCIAQPEPTAPSVASSPAIDASEGHAHSPQAVDAPSPAVEPATHVVDSAPAAPIEPSAPPAVRRRLALLIGNNAYPPPIPELETPLNDVGRIAQVLDQRFGFRTTVLRDASKADIVRALNAIAAEATEEDSVLVLYAGHGYLMDDNDMGYWIPVDGSVKSPANWISNSDITKFLRAIPARQIMLISDSCFSGSLTRELKLSSSAALSRDEILRRRSVLVFSSGGEEPVSDEGKDGHSIFAWSLLQAFDRVTGATPGFEVFRNVRSTVSEEYPQEPQYGAAVSAGHVVGGDYLLER